MAKKKPNANNLRQGQTIYRVGFGGMISMFIRSNFASHLKNNIRKARIQLGTSVTWDNSDWYATRRRAQTAANIQIANLMGRSGCKSMK